MKDLVLATTINITKKLNKRTLSVQEIMNNAQNAGITYADWRGILNILCNEKKLYFAGDIVRVPADLLA